MTFSNSLKRTKQMILKIFWQKKSRREKPRKHIEKLRRAYKYSICKQKANYKIKHAGGVFTLLFSFLRLYYSINKVIFKVRRSFYCFFFKVSATILIDHTKVIIALWLRNAPVVYLPILHHFPRLLELAILARQVMHSLIFLQTPARATGSFCQPDQPMEFLIIPLIWVPQHLPALLCFSLLSCFLEKALLHNQILTINLFFLHIALNSMWSWNIKKICYVWLTKGFSPIVVPNMPPLLRTQHGLMSMPFSWPSKSSTITKDGSTGLANLQNASNRHFNRFSSPIVQR